MTTYAPRLGAEATLVAPDGSATHLQDPFAGGIPPWSTLSWEERADYVARYCLCS